MITIEKIQNLYKDGPFNINGAGFGYKRINGYLTTQKSIVFHVGNKMLKEELGGSVLPEIIEIDGEVYPVDVVESKNTNIAGCNDPNSEVVKALQTDQKYIAGGLGITSTFSCGVPVDSSSGAELLPKSYGTFGGIFLDNLTSTLVGLTAGHILSKNIISAADQVNISSSLISNSYEDVVPEKLSIDLVNKNYYSSKQSSGRSFKQEIYHYSSSNFINTNMHGIGFPKRFKPLSLSPSATNTVDAGLISLYRSKLSIPKSFYQFGVSDTLSMPFANDTEINNIFNSQGYVFSVGRSSGPKLNECKIIIENVRMAKEVDGYSYLGTKIPILFQDIMVISRLYQDDKAFLPGDSGSLVYAPVSGTNKIIGLIFAVDGRSAYVSKITNISSQLNISPVIYNSATRYKVDSNLEQLSLLKNLDSSASDTIVSSGKTFFQAGITQEKNSNLIIKKGADKSSLFGQIYREAYSYSPKFSFKENNFYLSSLKASSQYDKNKKFLYLSVDVDFLRELDSNASSNSAAPGVVNFSYRITSLSDDSLDIIINAKTDIFGYAKVEYKTFLENENCFKVEILEANKPRWNYKKSRGSSTLCSTQAALDTLLARGDTNPLSPNVAISQDLPSIPSVTPPNNPTTPTFPPPPSPPSPGGGGGGNNGGSSSSSSSSSSSAPTTGSPTGGSRGSGGSGGSGGGSSGGGGTSNSCSDPDFEQGGDGKRPQPTFKVKDVKVECIGTEGTQVAVSFKYAVVSTNFKVDSSKIGPWTVYLREPPSKSSVPNLKNCDGTDWTYKAEDLRKEKWFTVTQIQCPSSRKTRALELLLAVETEANYLEPSDNGLQTTSQIVANDQNTSPSSSATCKKSYYDKHTYKIVQSIADAPTSDSDDTGSKQSGEHPADKSCNCCKTLGKAKSITTVPAWDKNAAKKSCENMASPDVNGKKTKYVLDESWSVPYLTCENAVWKANRCFKCKQVYISSSSSSSSSRCADATSAQNYNSITELMNLFGLNYQDTIVE